jgi:hypothetical protein
VTLSAAGVLFVSRFTAIVPNNPLALPLMRTPAGSVFVFLDAAVTSLTFGLGLVAMLVVVRRVVRSDRAAWIVTTLLVIAAAGADSLQGLAEAGALMLAVMLALRLGGVLGCITAFFVHYASMYTPLTWNSDAWYFGRSMVTLLVLAALCMYAFRTALGHRALFGSALVEDEANV